MKRILLLIFCLCLLNTVGQSQRIISYNLFDGTVDTLDQVDFDTTILSEITNYSIGNFDSEINNLSEDVPIVNVYPGSNFTYKRQASLDYEIDDFPIRTSVKLFKCVNDSLKNRCSGSLISRKHVLTACHCVAALNEDSLVVDSLLVCPAFDNGQYNASFDCSWVKRIFIFENWDLGTSDFSVLELEEPIGYETGWISIGYESNDSLLLDGIFYKFSYPGMQLLPIDSNSYNGDTLYYGYGVADITQNYSLGVEFASGIPGESGSSLIKIKNNMIYTTYGVLSFSGNLSHCRLTNQKYFAIKSIICNDLNDTEEYMVNQSEVSVYPNPTSDYLNVKYQGKDELNKFMIFDSDGRKVMEETNLTNEMQMNLSFLQNGIYILIVCTDKNRIVNRFIIAGTGK